MREEVVRNNQSIWDLAIRWYGAPEGVAQLIKDNPNLNFNDDVKAGSVIKITAEPINKAIVEYLEKKKLTPATAYQDGSAPITGGDFNNDFNNDFH